MRYIKIKSEKFVTNESKGTVTCIMEYDCKDAFEEGLAVVLSPWGIDRLMRRLGCKAIDAPDKTGFEVECTARCTGGDVFDETLGRYIAKDKCTVRLLDVDCRLSLKISDELYRLISRNQEKRVEDIDLKSRIIDRLRKC